jgi:hypothetical protein
MQAAGLIAGALLLIFSAQPGSDIMRVVAMIAGYLLIYFCCHASAHYFVGRVLGIRFTHYSIGGSTHASTYPPGLRQVFERLPFFAVHAGPQSMKAASPTAKALMFGAGMTSSILLSTLAALYAWLAGSPGGSILLIINVAWFIGALIGEARTNGDYAKAAKALRMRG